MGAGIRHRDGRVASRVWCRVSKYRIIRRSWWPERALGHVYEPAAGKVA